LTGIALLLACGNAAGTATDCTGCCADTLPVASNVATDAAWTHQNLNDTKNSKTTRDPWEAMLAQALPLLNAKRRRTLWQGLYDVLPDRLARRGRAPCAGGLS
jgi:hypothetical protein